MKTRLASSPPDHQGGDLLRQRVDDEPQEQREDGQNHQRNDVLLELLPDEEDEGLHRIDEPVEAGGGTTGRTGETGLRMLRNYLHQSDMSITTKR